MIYGKDVLNVAPQHVIHPTRIGLDWKLKFEELRPVFPITKGTTTTRVSDMNHMIQFHIIPERSKRYSRVWLT
jgi:hypothetical protein